VCVRIAASGRKWSLPTPMGNGRDVMYVCIRPTFLIANLKFLCVIEINCRLLLDDFYSFELDDWWACRLLFFYYVVLNSQYSLHSYHSHFNPDRVEMSQVFLQGTHILPKWLTCEKYCRRDRWKAHRRRAVHLRCEYFLYGFLSRL
jgi:hypothetical protein